jgi:hypothetical protein
MQKRLERSYDDFLPRLPRNRRIRTRARNSRRILRRRHQIWTTRSIFIINQYLQEETSLWWASKELLRGKLLSDYTGKNEKTKIVIFQLNRLWNCRSKELDSLPKNRWSTNKPIRKWWPIITKNKRNKKN